MDDKLRQKKVNWVTDTLSRYTIDDTPGRRRNKRLPSDPNETQVRFRVTIENMKFQEFLDLTVKPPSE